MKKIFCALIFCIISVAAFAQKTYDFNTRCKGAYNEIIQLKLDKGKELIDEERSQNPNNLVPEMLEGYIDFFTLFFNEDPEEYKLRKTNFDKRISAFDSGPENTPFYRYSKAVTYMQRAAVKIKFGERYSAGWDFKKANSQLKDNRSKYPTFLPNNMVYGAVEVILGTVPDSYKWITNLFGMKGSVNEGMRKMTSFINSNDEYAKLFADEAIFYYCYLMYYVQNKPSEVFRLIQAKKLDTVNNHLFTYLAANLSLNSKLTDNAARILRSRNPSDEYLKTPVWDFEMGFVKFYKLEIDSSITYFDKFLSDFKGQFYVKDVLQKISWLYYLKGNKEEAEKYRIQILKRGNTESDADKQAYRNARKNVWPNETLLKARILNDGGFNRDALKVLDGKTTEDFTSPEESLEFAYRLARIYDELGRDDEAIKYYQTTIELGKQRPEYYAARAAVQLGYIYEKRGNKNLAIAAFQQCLDLGDHEYKDSLDQRAKSGIARCKGE